MKQLAFAALAAVWGLVLPPGEALAATADGTLITNVACATYMSASGQGFTVSYCATQTVYVSSPCIALQKLANPTTQSSGGTVTFTIWTVNCSCTNSAFQINVTDRLPDNMTYSSNYTNWPGGPGTWTRFASSDNGAAMAWQLNGPANAQGAPYYLRYVLDLIGPCKSAFVQFTANVL